MELNDITFGTEARNFMQTYGVREDALRYARVHAAIEQVYEDQDVVVVYGHDPDGRRFRFTCLADAPSHVLTFRPVPDVAVG